jgi:hypothetical protein
MSISDILSDAESGIRYYLDDEDGPGWYGERGTPLRDWIESVAAQIGTLRRHLDLADDIPLAGLSWVTRTPVTHDNSASSHDMTARGCHDNTAAPKGEPGC